MEENVNKQEEAVSEGFLALKPEKRKGVLKTARQLLKIQAETKRMIENEMSLFSPVEDKE